jgi:hypothetical protein
MTKTRRVHMPTAMTLSDATRVIQAVAMPAPRAARKAMPPAVKSAQSPLVSASGRGGS